MRTFREVIIHVALIVSIVSSTCFLAGYLDGTIEIKRGAK
jgi:hypothetical protein